MRRKNLLLIVLLFCFLSERKGMAAPSAGLRVYHTGAVGVDRFGPVSISDPDLRNYDKNKNTIAPEGIIFRDPDIRSGNHLMTNEEDIDNKSEPLIRNRKSEYHFAPMKIKGSVVQPGIPFRTLQLTPENIDAPIPEDFFYERQKKQK